MTALTLGLAVLTACVDDGGDAGGDASGDTGASPPTTEPTDTTSEPTDVPDSCQDLCDEADSAGVAQGSCVSQELQQLGYDVVNAPYECAAIAGNRAGCLACMGTLGVSDGDCVTVAATCL